ncbi:hypothetical protein K8Q98_02375 [Candidatus Nomurabacteria bacterium]|nr:hypothetical protein [Candidatus Nomurabacteria bacterium]
MADVFKNKLYIGCALTNLPPDKKEEFLNMVSKLKQELKKHFELLEFLGIDDLLTNKPFTPREIYTYDIKNCLMKADCFLAICDYPALGLGYEIGTAVEKRGIPVLAVAHKDSKVSRSIIGIDHKNFNFYYYNSVDEIISKTLETLTN